MVSKRATAKRAAKSPAPRIPRTPKFEGLFDGDAEFLNDLTAKGRTLLSNVTSVTATIWEQGNFTVARLVVKMAGVKGKEEWVGVAKRNCNDDEFDWQRGRRVALARAARGEAVKV
jgi:hypothetical protein